MPKRRGVKANTQVVLVVDDEEPVRKTIRRVLEPARYAVIEASNGNDAIRMLADGRQVDLLIADREMPNLKGEEMARRIRASRPDLKVLYVTGYVDNLFVGRPTLWEGEAYLDKPFTPEGLLEAVSMILYGTLHHHAN